MQNVVQNFVAGVILLLERSIKPGDILEVEGLVVKVIDMGIRTTVVRTWKEEELIMPNSIFSQSPVKNYTLRDNEFRLGVVVGVSYDSDMKKVIEASMAVAIGAKLCEPGVLPMYPITPQTHIVERLADFVNDGDLNAEIIYAESEHSALSAALGASASGVRTFTATASQGLALMHEILFVVSGMRLPVVMAVANRALSAPINIWNDHQDSISARDSGWIQLYVESAQEALDTTIMAFKIAESMQTPVMVCLDGFTLSHVYEPVDVPSQKDVKKFLPSFKPTAILDPKTPMSFGPIAFPDTYMELKLEQQKAMQNSIRKIKTVNTEFNKKFGRKYGDGLVETYKLSDAKHAIIAMGTVCGTAKVVVDQLRKKGKKVGLIKLRSFRPFPHQEIQRLTKNLKALAVIDRNISIGKEGALYSEIKSSLYGNRIIINGFIAGLGGRDITPKHLEKALTGLGSKKKDVWLL